MTIWYEGRRVVRFTHHKLLGGLSELHPQSPAGFWSWATGGGERQGLIAE